MKKIKQQKIVYYNKKSMNTCVHIKSTERLLIGQDGVTYKNCNNKLMLQKIDTGPKQFIYSASNLHLAVSVSLYLCTQNRNLKLKKKLKQNYIGHICRRLCYEELIFTIFNLMLYYSTYKLYNQLL